MYEFQIHYYICFMQTWFHCALWFLWLFETSLPFLHLRFCYYHLSILLNNFFFGCLCCHCFTNNLLTYNKPYDFSPNYELLTLLPSLITQYLTKSFMPGPLIPLHGVSQMSFSKTLKPLYNDIFKLPLTLTTSSGCQCEHNHFLLLRNLHIVANVNTISINACKSWIS